MILPDGIEVYLKPAGRGTDDVKFPEFEDPAEDDCGGRYKRSFVPFTDKPFRVVVKFAETFNSFAASDVHVVVALSNLKDHELQEGRRQRWVLEKSMIPGRQRSFGGTGTGQNRIVFRMNDAHQDIQGIGANDSFLALADNRPYHDLLAPGTIAVVVQRGTIGRVVGRNGSNIGPDAHRAQHPIVDNTFKRLRSKNGNKYRFEFMPRSHSCLSAIEKANSMIARQGLRSEPEVPDRDRYDLIEDNEYVFARERSKAIWDRVLDEHRRGLQKQSVTIAQRQAPLTCNCPPEMHDKRESKKNNIHQKNENIDQPGTAEISKRLGGRETQISADGNSGTISGVETAGTKAPTETQAREETEAKTCTRCHNFKKPPRGKKLAWRARKARWMYVRENAPDEEDNEEIGHSSTSVVVSSGESRDRDDDGISMKASNEEPLESTGIVGGLSNSTLAVSRPSGDEDEEADEPVVERGNDSVTEPIEQPTVDVCPRAVTADAPQSSLAAPETNIAAFNTNQIQGTQSLASHVDVDLTLDNDDDDEIVVVKTEKVKPRSSGASGGYPDDFDDLQYRLEVLNRKKRMLEIEDEQAEIKRKLAKRGGCSKREVKEEAKMEN